MWKERLCIYGTLRIPINFPILELNVGSHHKYLSKWVIKYKNQRV